MKCGWGALGKIPLAVCCLATAAAGTYAQNSSTASSAQSTRTVLAEKARALEARGRPDMALQLWQQIVLSDPRNADALAGEARDYKLVGNADRSADALNRLRAVNPNSPEIAHIEAMGNQTESQQLKQAGALAQQNHPEEAMRIFRQLYADRPPNGDMALAYYQTLYATKDGKAAAIAGMRDLVAKNPAEPVYAVALGKMLTYDAGTRPEGLRILAAHLQAPEAQTAYRQALIWNAANPYTAGQLRDYLKAHPEDNEIARLLQQDEAKLAAGNTGIARTPAEKEAMAALNTGRLDEAQTRLADLLAAEPGNGRMLAAMGYLRMKQQNFSSALNYFSQAEASGYKDKSVEDALANSRYYGALSEANQAFDANQLEVAQNKFREALALNTQSADALSGLAGVLIKQQQYVQAASIYEQLLHLRPADADAWRGLFVAYARAGQNDKALATIARFPAPIKVGVAKNLDYLRTLASVYTSQGNNSEAQRSLVEALSLPVTDATATAQLETHLQLAGLLLELKRYAAAAAQYTQVLSQNPSQLDAWEGLITAHHNLGDDTQAIEDVKHMPPGTYEAALADPAFLVQLGAIYQQANQFEVAQGLLERAEQQSAAAGAKPSLDLQLQLASIYLIRNDPTRAYDLYRQALAANNDNPKAWLGLVTSLHAANHDDQALQQIASIPEAVRKQLDANIDFLQIEASCEAAGGDIVHALALMKTIDSHYQKTGQPLPPDVAVQRAWLLYNTSEDRALYDALMRLGGRSDLSNAQRETVQNIWANWSVRRATFAMDNGDYRRAIDILDAARLAFPNNITVSKAVAGGYAQVGRGREALAIYKTIPMQDANAVDFEGAVGAALAANDKAQAEIWLRQALERFPRDPVVLTLAAQYEQSRGDNERAADYYRASLAVMPKVSPVDRLAHALVNPDADTRPHKAVTAADLQRLLDPDNEPFPKTVKLPPLPAYGPDPYDGAAPVVPQPPAPNISTPASQQSQPGKNARPVIVPIPSGETHIPALFGAPVPVSSGGTGAAQLSSQAGSQPTQTLASEAWKGLVSSLIAGGRSAEALQELNRIPADVRAELDQDIDFQVGVANLYITLGDMRRAQPYLARIDDYFFHHPDDAPAGAALERAWMLYNMRDDATLYGALLHLDKRSDLTGAQQGDEHKLWASYAVRRANDAMDHGNIANGVEILQAATEDFPEDVGVRRAVASAYARTGRVADAVALYKSIPMNDANEGDYQSAISAALSARDMAQCETWLRQGLTSFPNSAQILSLAGTFEQVRGNNQRAADFFRAAALSAPHSPGIEPLQNQLALPDSYRAPSPGSARSLLNPAFSTNQPTENAQVPLPSYHALATNQPQAASNTSPLSQWLTQPSKNPLPLPTGTTAQAADIHTGIGQRAAVTTSPDFAAPATSGRDSFTGRVTLPATEEYVASMDGSSASQDATPQVRPAFPVVPDSVSQPTIRPLANAPVAPYQGSVDVSQSRILDAQYTPSAQQATTGAYSAPQQSAARQAAQVQAQQPAPPTPPRPQASSAAKPPAANAARRKPATTSASNPTTTPPAIEASSNEQPSPPTIASSGTATPQQPGSAADQSTSSSQNGLSDQELEDRNLPPLHGPWVRTQRQAPQLNPRDLAEQQLAQIESSYSPWFGGTANNSYRSGFSGFSRLGMLEDPFEISTPMGYHARFTVVAKPVFLDAGQADGSAVISVLQTTSAGTRLTPIPEPIGTLTNSDTNIPAQQNSMGVGGELQLASPSFAIAGGYTPYGFLISHFTARMAWKPAGGPFAFTASRDSEKDSQLSYAGLRDPAAGPNGATWGGVISNQGQVQFNHADAQSGFYFAVGGQYLAGMNVRNNTRIDGTAGAWWRAYTAPEFGTLTVGGNFFAMHYSNNQNAFTYGMGGYFSPQSYFLAKVPIRWTGHYQTHWHYSVSGGIGAQAFQEDATPLWPLFAQQALQAANGNPMLPNFASVSANYDLHGQFAYQVSPHWYAGATLEANNTRDYNVASVGFFIRFLFREQPSTAAAPTGLFPTEGVRPFTVP